MVSILLSILLLTIGHLVSIYEYKILRNKEESIDSLMHAPYGRIIPLHLTIIASGFIMIVLPPSGDLTNAVLLVLFMWLKTIADFLAHNKKHAG